MKKFLKYVLSTIAGISFLALGYFILGQILGFVIGMVDSKDPVPTEQIKSEETTDTEPKPTRKVVGYTSDDEPIYEDQIYIPEPTYYDEYGVKYIWVEGTLDEYYIDEDYQEVIETPESSAFTEISYWPFFSELRVQFRNSGICYIYYEVEPETWCQFKNANSKGSFFNENIKGQYEYDRD